MKEQFYLLNALGNSLKDGFQRLDIRIGFA